MSFDGKAFGAEIVGIVKGYLQKELVPIVTRLDALEKAIKDAPQPKDFTGDIEALRADIKAIPAPLEVDEVVRAMPDIVSIVSAEVKNAVEAIAIPSPEKGADGIGLAGAMIDRKGHLIVTMTNGVPTDLGPVVGKDGEPGAAGRDGFNLEDFDAEVMEDGRTVLLSFTGKHMDYKVELGFGVMLYRGVWKEGEYEKGDTVTWGGSLWHCDVAKTSAKPGDADWTLCAKKGRDGKDASILPEKAMGPVRVGVPAKVR